MFWIEKLLRKWLKFKEIGWEEIGEEFTRFTLLKTPFFNIYIHKLIAPVLHPSAHDHPWHFWAFVLSGGYWEYTKKGKFWRGPSSILFRQATFSHNVITNPGKTNWSVIITSPRIRKWGFTD